MPASTISPSRANRTLLFDWGDTLMRVFPDSPGPMSVWPQVAAMPHAHRTLAALYPNYTLCLATNAADSTEQEIRTALARVGLDHYIDRVYCYRLIGYRKPHPEFYAFILEDLNLPPAYAVMIGDDYDADIIGALRFGLHAVWLSSTPTAQPSNPFLKTIPNLSLLPNVVKTLFA
jgi:putative hydrolase of the HAD superfamily